MRYTVERNFVQVVGYIWQPGVGMCAMEYPLCVSDVLDIGEFTRGNVEAWLATHSGDFESILDFYATAGDAEIPWNDVQNEMTFNDAMYGAEVEEC